MFQSYFLRLTTQEAELPNPDFSEWSPINVVIVTGVNYNYVKKIITGSFSGKLI